MFGKNPFLNLIHCKVCKSNFKQKRERGKIKYICSGYDRRGLKSKCERVILSEKEILYFLSKHLDREINRKEVREVIEGIDVYKDKIIFNYKDNTKSIYSINEIIF